MKVFSYLVVMILVSICNQARASVEVTNSTIVLPAARIVNPRRPVEFCARLSPDGRHVLFPKLADPAQRTYRLVLLDTKSKKESEIPVDLPQGYETVFTRFNFFNPDGDKIALFSIKQQPNPRTAELLIYEVPSAKLVSTGIFGQFVMGQFGYTGKRLLVSRDDSCVAFASLDNPAVGQPVTPGWVHSCSPHSPYAAVFVRPGPGTGGSSFVLLNLKDNKTSPLPVHERNSKLDDVASQWNLDGRYVFYVDLVERENRRFDPVTRVWDVTTNTEKAAIKNMLCIGPGPAGHLMVMAGIQGDLKDKIITYDLNSGDLSPAGPPSARPVHAWNDRILYVASDKDGNENVYIADIVESKN